MADPSKELFVPASTIIHVCPQCGKDQYYQERHAREDEILIKCMTLLVEELKSNGTMTPRQQAMKKLLTQFADSINAGEEARDVENEARKATTRLKQLEEELSGD